MSLHEVEDAIGALEERAREAIDDARAFRNRGGAMSPRAGEVVREINAALRALDDVRGWIASVLDSPDGRRDQDATRRDQDADGAPAASPKGAD